MTQQPPGLHSRAASIHDAIIDDPIILIAGSTGGYGDDRPLGEKAKDALPGSGRGGNTTGYSSGQGYGQEGTGGYSDDRTLGEKAKDALPGTGRGGSTTGHSSGHGHSREGSMTSGTGKGMPLLACTLQLCVGYSDAVICISKLWGAVPRQGAADCGWHTSSACPICVVLSFSLAKCQVCSTGLLNREVDKPMLNTSTPGLQGVLGVMVTTGPWGRRSRMPCPGLGKAAAAPVAKDTIRRARV